MIVELNDAQIGYWVSESRLFIQQPDLERRNKGSEPIVNKTRTITSIVVKDIFFYFFANLVSSRRQLNQSGTYYLFILVVCLSTGVTDVIGRVSYIRISLFSPLGKLAGRAIYFSDVFSLFYFYFFLMVDFLANVAETLIEQSSPKFQDW